MRNLEVDFEGEGRVLEIHSVQAGLWLGDLVLGGCLGGGCPS